MNKWDYINELSIKSNEYGDKLIELMIFANKKNLRDITEEEIKNFCERKENAT